MNTAAPTTHAPSCTCDQCQWWRREQEADRAKAGQRLTRDRRTQMLFGPMPAHPGVNRRQARDGGYASEEN